MATGFRDLESYLRLAQIHHAHYDVLARLGQDWQSGNWTRFPGGQSYGYDGALSFLEGNPESPLDLQIDWRPGDRAVFRILGAGFDPATIRPGRCWCGLSRSSSVRAEQTTSFGSWRFEQRGEHASALAAAEARGGVADETSGILRLLEMVSRAGLGTSGRLGTALVAALFHATSWAGPDEQEWSPPPLGLGPVLGDGVVQGQHRRRSITQRSWLAPIPNSEELTSMIRMTPSTRRRQELGLQRLELVVLAAGFDAVVAELPGDMRLSDAYLLVRRGRLPLSSSLVASAYQLIRAWEADTDKDPSQTLVEFLEPRKRRLSRRRAVCCRWTSGGIPASRPFSREGLSWVARKRCPGMRPRCCRIRSRWSIG